MLNKALEKLKAEVEANRNNDYVKIVGEFLINFVEEHPEAAEKIMTADKTIAKSLESMKKEAAKKKIGNMAMISPQEGFSIVMKYFEIEMAVAPQEIVENTIKTTVRTTATCQQAENLKVKKQGTAADFDVKLTDFI